MRISTNQIFEGGALGIQSNQANLFRLQNQMSTGRRMLSPADDPVAAAQALIVTQTKEVSLQQMENQKSAMSQLGLVDAKLQSLTELIQNVHERVIQAGNTTLDIGNRGAIAASIEGQLSELVGLANSQNGVGDYLFSGYQGATLPFAVSGAAAVSPALSSPYAYYGDDGERLLQVGASRQMGVNVSGNDLFMVAKNGNGSFVTQTGGNTAGGINQGTATGGGTVLDPQLWVSALNGFGWQDATNPALEVRFTVVGAVTTYTLYDISVPAGPVALTGGADTYTPGQAIPLVATGPAQDFGAQIVVKGQPADNDTFSIEPSTSQSLFQTLQNVIGLLRTPIGPTNTTTQYTNDLGLQMLALDRALDNTARVQSSVGTRLKELDALVSSSEDVDLQYAKTLSTLQDLDYVKAISDFTQQQTQLEAAQKSFVTISGLSLFNYI
jgi:flagellar hook-associated protein 3 FlgL